ncbi:protein kinase [Streptomyces sp. LHD-70]|uniref:protein kinase domain-containing protein n=1 Tax=Streptomyces sp. LHD-70 TaxID=3072140 RepID=UPI00280C72A1|nr:protein kinase [Streptomyces sp. LHD-70]MDQ8704306.1 protein kinase [Streptomyces sp. LHD-70]
MDDYAGRVLAGRYRLPLPPSDAYEFAETRAFDTYSGQEVLVRQVPLPETVDAEVVDESAYAREYEDGYGGYGGYDGGRAARRPADPAVRRAIEAAQAAAQIPDHPRLDQVFDVFAEDGSLWIVSELVAALPLAALIAEKPLTPYRAAEVASEVLTALRALHAHGWVHRNITMRTVLVCDNGRVMLTGLATGAAEEALCGYDPVPEAEAEAGPEHEPESGPAPEVPGPRREVGSGGRAALPGADSRAARSGAIAAYRAGTQAATRGSDASDRDGTGRDASGRDGTNREASGRDGTHRDASDRDGSDSGPPGRIVDPYGVSGRSSPRTGNPVAAPNSAQKGGRWEEPLPPKEHSKGGGRGPTTPLAAERARQARMNVVGAVTERWAPEQAGPVHENWQLAAPVGPATDLWALGALLFRAVQGHAPYPEDSAYELVQLVCGEPPAFAEECGPLRPVVESLLRQDPTERPDFEELRGWLRSLVRSAPEPEAGENVVPAPPFDRALLPVVRRRGELVRKRRAGRHKSRHRRGPKPVAAGPAASPAAAGPTVRPVPARPVAGAGGVSADLQEQYRSYEPRRAARKPARTASGQAPKRLGRMLLVLILLGLVAAVAYAVLFMPKAEPRGSEGSDTGGRTGQAGSASSAPAEPGQGGAGQDAPGDGNEESPTSQRPDPQSSGPDVPEGFELRKDPEGFRVAVAKGWERRGANSRSQVAYGSGQFELIVVPGRDKATGRSSDPLYYQREREVELQPFRDSTWATSTGMRRIDVGGQVRAEGQFTWTDSGGDEVYVRNAALLIDGRYHVVLVKGPEAERDEVTRLHEQAVAAYRPDK